MSTSAIAVRSFRQRDQLKCRSIISRCHAIVFHGHYQMIHTKFLLPVCAPDHHETFRIILIYAPFNAGDSPVR